MYRTAALPLFAMVLLGAAYAQVPITCLTTGAELPPGATICPYTGVAPGSEEPHAVLRWDFEEDQGSFMPAEGVTLELISDPEVAKVGTGCLLVDVSQAFARSSGDLPSSLVIPQPPRPVGAVAFWAKAPTGARLAMLGVEEDGSLYMCMFTLPVDRWHRVVVDIPSMVLASDKSYDENDRFDPDQVQFLALLDLAAVPDLGPMGSANTYYLDDFTLLAEAVREKPYAVPGGYSLGDFGVSGLGWIAVGLGQTDLAPGDEAHPWVLRLNSLGDQGVRGFIGLPRLWGVEDSWTGLQFDLRSSIPCQAAVMLKENTGGAYVALIPETVGTDWVSVSLSTTDFTPQEGSWDTHNGVLDTDRVEMIMVINVSALQNATAFGNVMELTGPMVVPLQK